MIDHVCNDKCRDCRGFIAEKVNQDTIRANRAQAALDSGDLLYPPPRLITPRKCQSGHATSVGLRANNSLRPDGCFSMRPARVSQPTMEKFRGRCNSQTKWGEWKCETEGCTFEIPIRYNIIPASKLAPDHTFKAEGHSIPFDKWGAAVVRTKAEFHDY